MIAYFKIQNAKWHIASNLHHFIVFDITENIVLKLIIYADLFFSMFVANIVTSVKN